MSKKEQLLLGIAELFNQKGYDKASIRDISRELNISKPGLYFYFENKQQMLFELAYNFINDSNNLLKESLKYIVDPKEKLRKIIESHIEHFVKYPAQVKVVVYEVHSLEDDYAKKFRVVEKEYINIIRSVLSDLEKTNKLDTNLNIATFTLLGTLNWAIQWYKPEKVVAPEELIEEIWQFFLKGLGLEK